MSAKKAKKTLKIKNFTLFEFIYIRPNLSSGPLKFKNMPFEFSQKENPISIE